MSEKITFAAQPRSVVGKKVKTLRKSGLVPANISGDVKESIPVAVNQVAFTKLYDKVGDTGLFYLKVEGEQKDRPVLVSELQLDPMSAQVVHVVFRQVDLSEKVKAEVPVEVIGELQVKDALIVTVHDAIEVEALPQDLPEKFVVDAAAFQAIGDTLTFRQLKFDAGKVTIMIPEDKLDEPVVMVQEVKEEVEVAPVAPAEGAEGAPAGQAPAAEGDKPAQAAPAEEKKAE